MSFELDISKFAAKAKGNAEKVVKKVVLDLGKKVVERSPVGDASYWKNPPPKGYVGGRFRANWQHGTTMPSGDLQAIDPSGGVSLSRIESSLTASQAFGVHYLVNNLPYAQRLENGWSRQAPQGMVGLTVVEFEAVVRDAAKAVNP